jgi:hypothetical protein
MKYCITCGKNRHLFMYHTDDSKYQIKSNNGKCIECRLCTFKRSIKDKGLMSRVDGKFTFVPMTRIEIIKYVLKR